MSRRTGVLGLVFMVLAGCFNPQTRMQMAEDAEVKKDLSLKTVGDIADIRTIGPVQVSGIALVTGLDGTGGSPQGQYSKALEQLLLKQKIEHVKEILASPDNAMVLVTGFIPPGARVGDRIDVEVVLPPGSKATSLAGGMLQMCVLRNHDSAKSLVPTLRRPRPRPRRPTHGPRHGPDHGRFGRRHHQYRSAAWPGLARRRLPHRIALLY